MTRLAIIVMLLGLLLPAHLRAAETAAPQEQSAAAISADMNKAIRQVAKIVNQPVIHVPRTAEMAGVGTFSPGWFHAGANMPAFDTVDIRKSQEFPYAQYIYVTSDLNPTEMFIGKELEFNANTKYFYTDRTLPKKKLSEAEMLEINRLYRVIGDCEKKLAALRGDKASASSTGGTASAISGMNFIRNIIIGIVLALGAVIFMSGKKKIT